MAYRETINGILSGIFAGNQSGNATVMLMLGGFKFSLNTAAFTELQRSTAYSWPAQQRLGKFDALQFTGPGEDRITLPGVIYPDFRGGVGQLDQLREIASAGRPLRLVASTGAILGVWVIESIEETQSAFKPNGGPRKQEFTLRIRKFGDDAQI
jgi:phage protein U